MCGITGFISKQPIQISYLVDSISALKHRGPDAAGMLVMNDCDAHKVISSHSAIGLDVDQKKRTCLGLGHTRFSIIDTVRRSDQPLSYKDKHITFNGEIFNYLELREELSKFYSFETNSDTEVVLKAYDHWGRDCFKKFNGFWAIAILDITNNIIILSRDRYGEKPLYVYETEGSVYWSSEIKSLKSLLGHSMRVSDSSALLYLAYDRRNTLTHSMYDGMEQIDPGTYKVFDITSCASVSLEPYYALPEPKEIRPSEEFDQNTFEDLLLDSVRLRLRSDVPLAISLSGGLDSASLALAMRKIMPKSSITAYTIKYEDDSEFDETYLAQKIADSLKINLKVITISKDAVWNSLNRALDVAEEPTHSFATATQLLSWEYIGKEGCKVLIHGSSADELLYGYQYLAEICDIDTLKRLEPINRIQGNGIFHYKSLGRIVKWIINGKFSGFENIKSKLEMLPFLQEFRTNITNIDRQFIQYFKASHKNAEERRYADFRKLRIPYWCSLMDKNMMSVPLEVRSPFLDHRLVDYCMRHRSGNFYKNGLTKMPLRRFMNKYLPEEVVWNKTKVGFSAPIDAWMSENNDNVLKYIVNNRGKYIDEKLLIANWAGYDSSLKWRLFCFAKWLKTS